MLPLASAELITPVAVLRLNVTKAGSPVVDLLRQLMLKVGSEALNDIPMSLACIAVMFGSVPAKLLY